LIGKGHIARYQRRSTPITKDSFSCSVVPDIDTGIAVLEEPVGVITEPFIRLHGDPPEVECVPKAIVGRLEVGREGP
jgi:hypothetical protein